MKYSIFIYSILLIFFDVYTSEYKVPRAAYSISSVDLDLDGDKDIIVGHNYSLHTNWSGISILLNNGAGEFMLTDSVFLFGWQPDVEVVNLNLNDFPEIIAKYENQQNENEYIAIINNFNLADILYFSLNTYEGIDNIAVGDIENDGDIDIIISSDKGQFWGILYNDGTGQFSSPTYYSINHPKDIKCGDLNNDHRDDVVICGPVQVFFSDTLGFTCSVIDSFEDEIEIADMDNDGDKDMVGLFNIYLIGYTGITLYENTGNNDFKVYDEVLFQPPLSYFELSDVNNDSLPDVVCTGDSGIYILYNEGEYNLSDPQFYSVENFGEGLRRSFCADLDGNGYSDILTIRYLHAELPSNLNILFNDGTGQFIENPLTGIKSDQNIPTPLDFNLVNYPNPFNNNTIIQYEIHKAVNLEISLYNVAGERIKSLFKGYKPIGTYEILLTATDLVTGLYLYSLKSDESVLYKKCLLIK